MISLDRLEIPNLGFSRIFVIARIRYKNRCELINILFNLHQSVHPLLGPYSRGHRGGPLWLTTHTFAPFSAVTSTTGRGHTDDRVGGAGCRWGYARTYMLAYAHTCMLAYRSRRHSRWRAMKRSCTTWSARYGCVCVCVCVRECVLETCVCARV